MLQIIEPILKMKLKLFLLSAVGLFFVQSVFAQGFEPSAGFVQANFGTGVQSWGVPVYAGVDFGIGNKITLGPEVSFVHYNQNGLVYNIGNFQFKADYHFANWIPGLPEELDLYGGFSLLYSYWGGDNQDSNFNESGFKTDLHGGARWYWNSQWAVNAEAGNISVFKVGLSYIVK